MITSRCRFTGPSWFKRFPPGDDHITCRVRCPDLTGFELTLSPDRRSCRVKCFTWDDHDDPAPVILEKECGPGEAWVIVRNAYAVGIVLIAA